MRTDTAPVARALEARAEPSVAVVEPEAEAVLLSFDTVVSHRTVAVNTVQSKEPP
ncbi:hypothetical protein ACQP1W_44435 [Spirillospora sp. CA-255316]